MKKQQHQQHKKVHLTSFEKSYIKANKNWHIKLDD